LLGLEVVMRLPLLVTTIVVISTTGCSRYSVRRAALVPHAAPTMRDGQPMGDAVAAVDLGVQTLVQTRDPAEGDDTAGLHIPRIQTNGGLRFQPAEGLDIGIIYERGWADGATSLAEDQPDTEGDAQGFGVTMGYSMATGDPNFRVGLSLDLINYNVPYVEYRTCVENCGISPYTDVDRHKVNVGAIAVGAIPSYQHGPWTFFGSLTLRNHPTVPRGGTEGPIDGDDIEGGPLNAIVAAGASFTTPARVKASILVYQPMTNDPVDYSPTVAVMISLPLGNRQF
jgi:hypothetical protein